jgi:predicted nucleic acid-binding protein
MLVELYLKLCNARIFPNPFLPSEAAAWCQGFRTNVRWRVVENAPIMSETWRLAAQDGFAFRRIIDARLALTLRHHGVTEFATANTKDFEGFGFSRVWNPLAE